MGSLETKKKREQAEAERNKKRAGKKRKNCLNITKNSRKNYKKNVAKFVEIVYSKRTRQSIGKAL